MSAAAVILAIAAKKHENAREYLRWARAARVCAGQFRSRGEDICADRDERLAHQHIQRAAWLRDESKAIRASVARGEWN